MSSHAHATRLNTTSTVTQAIVDYVLRADRNRFPARVEIRAIM